LLPRSLYIANKPAICPKPPTGLKNFTAVRKILNGLTVQDFMFLLKYKEKQLCVDTNILTGGVILTKLFSNAGISVLQVYGLGQIAVLGLCGA